MWFRSKARQPEHRLSTASADLFVYCVGGPSDWALHVITADCPDGVEYGFSSEAAAQATAEWLAGCDLSGRIYQGVSLRALETVLGRREPKVRCVTTPVVSGGSVAVSEARSGLSEAEVMRLVDSRIEELLTQHYREVLSSREGRKMWRKLLADAAAAERVEKLRQQ